MQLLQPAITVYSSMTPGLRTGPHRANQLSPVFSNKCLPWHPRSISHPAVPNRWGMAPFARIGLQRSTSRTWDDAVAERREYKKVDDIIMRITQSHYSFI